MTRNKLLLIIMKIAVSGTALYVVFSKTDISHMFSILGSINIFYFLAAALTHLSTQLVATIRWRILIPEQWKVNFPEKFRIRKLFSLYMIGAFFSSFLPGVVGGDAVRAYYLNKDAKKISLTLASIFFDRYLGYVGLMTIGITAFPFALKYFGESPQKWAMPVLFAIFIVSSFILFGLQIGRKFRVISEFYGYFNSLKAKKDLVAKAFLLSLLTQLLNFTKVIILAYAMGENIPLLIFFIFLPIVMTITSLPISISGLGLREGSVVLLFGLIGIKPEVATALALAWFFAVFTGSLPGLVAYIRRTNRAG
ncbi:MAG: lysylphosphatidylglycerol synthase transmembrane domain-containing protein [Nitrospirota bacterium]|nr:lysylphosphatidylglycerol synthase transmembrane domain-containing protein [Nitrospirota bacterium]